MFDYNKMIKRAIEFFPHWTDIRKRYKTSNGGNLLGAVLDETIKIEEAIQEYIDSYFLETYEGHENEIMAFSYIANIGKIEDLSRLYIKHNNKMLMITTDVRLFDKDKHNEYVYYEDGSLHIKETQYVENLPLVVTFDNESTTEYQLVKHHVWNIFDEFATFVNTRRYENETNKELLDRILYITKNLPNGSEDGLKHAIISELMHFDPNISMNDIKIERATPENLRKPYEDFESLLEKLMYVNRDVFKCKRWDFDYWLYDFESISYIPHKWNETLSYWQNGIGHGDDLEVIISDGSDTTDAKLTLYNKSLVTFEKYVQNKDIDYDIDFKLTKYNNMLNKSNIKYKIKASEAVDITNENINLYLYETNSITETRNVEELYSFGRNIEILDNSTLPSSDINWYKIQFKQKGNDDLKISNAKVIYTNDNTGRVEETQDLLHKQSGFIYNAEKELISISNQKTINRAEDFNQINDLVTVSEGITIADNRVAGMAKLPLNNYLGMYMTVESSCEEVDVPKNLIKSNGTYWNEAGELVIRGDYTVEDKVVTIDLTANSFQFEVISSKITGRSTVTVIDDGVEQEPVVLETGYGKNIFSIKPTNVARDIRIIINTLSFNDVVIGKFKYSNYSINIVDDHNSITIVDKDKYLLPTIRNNNLTINMGMTTGKKPILHKIIIGSSIDEVSYTTDYITSKSLCSRKFEIKTNADMYLLKTQVIDQEIITNIDKSIYDSLYVLIMNYFRNSIGSFLVEKDLATNDNIMNDNFLNVVDTFISSIYGVLNLKVLLAPYVNSLLDADGISMNLLNKVLGNIYSFLESKKDSKIILNKYSISDICKSLRKPANQLQLEDKIEWYRLSIDITNKIIEYAANECTTNLGPFNPTLFYKGKVTNITEDCFVRLDLSEYETVTSITSNGGSPILIEESGVTYYNIRLSEGSIVSTVTITGTKNKALRVVPLLDMIAYYIPNFDPTVDRVLCSRLLDSVIVSRTNTGGTPFNSLIKLSSEMLTGISATKYELELPEHIGSRYGNHTLGSNDNPIHYKSFDYISFYPAGAIIHEAINEYNSYVPENRNIKIVNNFSPALDMSKNLIYTVENMNESEKNKYVIRFHNQTNANDNIYSLDTWSVGQQNIAIYNNIDLYNDISYTANTYDINSKELLSTSIDIKNVYTLNNNMILDTTQYIVEPPIGMSVKYETYDGSAEKSHLLKVEEIIIDSNRFNKLIYSNIDIIFHLSKKMYDGNYIKDDVNCTLLNEQGIIIWDNDVKVGTKYFLIYAIKKPINFLIDLEELYKAINYDIEAYNRLDTVLLSNIKDNYDYSFSKIDKIEDVDLIHIDCTNPTFEGIVLNNERVIRFNKYIDEPTILIRSGYYYINGREYFLYSEDEDEDIVNNQYYGSENVNISGGEILTYKPTNNYLTNTEMRLKGKAGIYDYDCNQELRYGISTLNALTACNSFNQWSYFAMTPELVDGMNGIAMKFTSNLNCAYSYLDITDALIDNEINYISLLATSDLKVFIGKEEPYLNLNFNRALNITLIEEIKSEGSESRITSFIKEADEHYYLVIQGSGILDDIIITTNRYDALNGHNKNIDLLGLDLLETKMQGSEYRMTIDNNKDYTPYEAGLMSDGSIKTTSMLDWYITQIFKVEKEDDYFKCVLNNVDVSQSYMSTNNIDGYIITPPIFVSNHATIKKLIFKLNDIELDNMSGFKVVVYTSGTYDGDYSPIGTFTSNKGYVPGQNLMEYIKFKIEIPPHKILHNMHVFAEYTSSEENLLKLPLHESGYIISKIYDLQDILNYRLKDLGIEDISNINDIDIYIRASRDIDKLEVWHEWQKINITDDLNLKDYLKFYDVRFMQIKILIKSRKAYVKFNHLDVEVI